MGKMYRPNLHPSTDLAYILGAFLGDGGLGIARQSRNHIVQLQVKSLIFAKKFLNALSNIGLNPKLYRLHTRDRWQTIATSKVLYYFLKRIKEEIPTSVLPFIGAPHLKKRFVEGFIDAEGTICMRKDNRWSRPHSYLFVGFYNSDKALIGLVIDTIRQLGFECGISEYRSNQYQGYILGREEDKRKFIDYIYHDEANPKSCETEVIE